MTDQRSKLSNGVREKLLDVTKLKILETSINSRPHRYFCTRRFFHETRWNKCPPFHLHRNRQRPLRQSRAQEYKTRQVSAPAEKSCKTVPPHQTHSEVSQPCWCGEHGGIQLAVKNESKLNNKNIQLWSILINATTAYVGEFNLTSSILKFIG